MFEMIDQWWENYQKDMEKYLTRSLGIALKSEKGGRRRSVNQSGKNETNRAKRTISSANKGLKEALKGQFGDKVSLALDEQEKALDKG
ncbi:MULTISPECIES: hypothetical protein [unclassified Enterococcus]|uniref:hypothetical protein n=1 Tax=unclassified Enterococcus TaxID=2608891 RepID=UPI001A92E1CD|nr:MULTISPECIES: hypothetical protein [unclassified Enterococcus]MBO0462500.1 hypothetical protein [Enterococcus sp. DIV1298c]MBO1301054.1 hypothetical protein [Enterococcus sp. DIV1271a]